MQGTIFELCVETIDACLAARDGGAHRLELCSGLSEGGITPSHGLILDAVERSGLPVHVLVRTRGGNFAYSAAEIDVMRRDILHIKVLVQLGRSSVSCSPMGRWILRPRARWSNPHDRWRSTFIAPSIRLHRCRRLSKR